MLEHEKVLTYKCPDTGRAVRTAILTNKTTLSTLNSLKLSEWCPHWGPHTRFAGYEASLTYSLPTEAREMEILTDARVRLQTKRQLEGET